jgi:hypothetical protein
METVIRNRINFLLLNGELTPEVHLDLLRREDAVRSISHDLFSIQKYFEHMVGNLDKIKNDGPILIFLTEYLTKIQKNYQIVGGIGRYLNNVFSVIFEAYDLVMERSSQFDCKKLASVIKNGTDVPLYNSKTESLNAFRAW